jgi:peptidoglycan/xylan/chitin deacetylase (PgdA/CDA1 family)
MAGFRNTIIKSIGKISAMLPTKLLLKVSNQSLILPFYHTISDNALPHISNLYPVKGIDAFKSDLDFLTSFLEPISYDAFIDIKRRGIKPTKPSFLLSFDDGLSEFHDVIAPILLEKGIPAICFLNSQFVDNKDLFYRYKASLLIDFVQKYPTVSKRLEALFNMPNNVEEALLSVSYANKEILDKAANEIELNFGDFLQRKSPYLSSEQISSLIGKGFKFGAHSIDHPEYRYLTVDEQIRQTQESINSIGSAFSLDYKAFSFPFTDFDVSQQFFNHLAEKNIVDATFGSAGQKEDSALNNFQRIPFEMAQFSAKEILNAELLYYMLKFPFGKNRITRNVGI